MYTGFSISFLRKMGLKLTPVISQTSSDLKTRSHHFPPTRDYFLCHFNFRFLWCPWRCTDSNIYFNPKFSEQMFWKTYSAAHFTTRTIGFLPEIKWLHKMRSDLPVCALLTSNCMPEMNLIHFYLKICKNINILAKFHITATFKSWDIWFSRILA